MPMTRGNGGSGRLRAGVEEALGLELLLELLERELERAQALRLEQLDHQLVLAARGVDVEAAEGQHLHAVLGLEAHAPAPAAEEHAAELGRLVLQREVGVAGARACADC